MLQLEVDKAQEIFPLLIAAAEAGEEIVILQEGVPVARLVAFEQLDARLGLLAGLVDPASVPDFVEPMCKRELAEWAEF